MCVCVGGGMRFFTLDLVASSSYAITSSQHWPHLTEEEAEAQGEGASRTLWGTPSSIPAPLAPRGRSPEQSIELNVPVLPQRLAARLCGAGLGLRGTRPSERPVSCWGLSVMERGRAWTRAPETR